MTKDCAVCGKRASKGRPKKLKNQEEVERYAYRCGRALALNDVLCDACRRITRVEEASDIDDESLEKTYEPDGASKKRKK